MCGIVCRCRGENCRNLWTCKREAVCLPRSTLRLLCSKDQAGLNPRFAILGRPRTQRPCSKTFGNVVHKVHEEVQSTMATALMSSDWTERAGGIKVGST